MRNALWPRIAANSVLCAATLALAACGGGSSNSPASTSTTPTATYSISAKISGLTTNGLALDVNGTDLSIASGSTSDTLASNLTNNTAFSISVASQPPGEACTVGNGSGTIASADVSNVSVSCGYTISGTLSGLGSASGLTLLLNGGNATSIPANATTFLLNGTLQSGSSYEVSVGADPSGLLCMPANGSGTIASAGISNVTVNCGAPTEKVLYSFQSAQSSAGLSDGAGPAGSLSPAGNGLYYGVTYLGGQLNPGGTSADGTLFEYNFATNAETILYEFYTGSGNPSDLGMPAGSLLAASNGLYYGLASGGQFNSGVIYQFDPQSGAVSVAYAFTGAADGANPENELIQASDGKLYGIATGGGAYGNGVIFSFDPASGQEAALYSFHGTSDGSPSPMGPGGGPLLQGADGNLYGTVGLGGSSGCNCGVLFEYDLTTQTYTVLHAFTGGTDGSFPQGNLVQDSSGNLYGETTSGGDPSCLLSGMQPGCGTIFEYDPKSAQESIAHVFGSSAGDGLYPNTGMMLASDGQFYGLTGNGGSTSNLTAANAGYGTIFQFNPSTAQETVLYSFSGPPDGAFSEGEGNLVQMPDGNFIGLTTGGGSGASPVGTIFELYLK